VADLAALDVQQNLKETIATFTTAAEEVDAALKATGNIPSVEVGDKLKLIGTKIAEAETFFARALDSKPLYDLLCDIEKRVGNEPAAERYAKQGRRFLSDELEFKGKKQAFYGDNTKALSFFEEALKLTPDHDFALSGAESSRKRIERSLKDLAKLQKAAQVKNTPKEHLALGSAYADLGRIDEALASFEAAIKLDDKNPDAWARKGAILHAKGQVKEALEMYQKAVAIKPTSMAGRRGVNYATFDLENPQP
jgi:tetratricopeptide (TPR) repeat protein